MNFCEEHDSHWTISVMPTFIIDSTPTNHIYYFYRGPKQVVGNCPYRPNQIPIFVMESIFGTTQPAISISSQILITHVHAIFEHTSSFIVAPSHPIIQVLNDQYLIVNPTGNSILLTYLGTMDRPMQATTIFPTHG